MEQWQLLIDRAASLCGSQNKLAARLNLTSANMSSARNCRRRLSTDQLEALAEILRTDPAEIWLAQEAARNPFRQSAAGALATVLIAIVSMALAFALPSESQALARLSARSAVIVHARKRGDRHIHCGQSNNESPR